MASSSPMASAIGIDFVSAAVPGGDEDEQDFVRRVRARRQGVGREDGERLALREPLLLQLLGRDRRADRDAAQPAPPQLRRRPRRRRDVGRAIGAFGLVALEAALAAADAAGIAGAGLGATADLGALHVREGGPSGDADAGRLGFRSLWLGRLSHAPSAPGRARDVFVRAGTSILTPVPDAVKAHRRWKGTSITTVWGRSNSAFFSFCDDWLCRKRCHGHRATYSGRITVTVSSGSARSSAST